MPMTLNKVSARKWNTHTSTEGEFDHFNSLAVFPWFFISLHCFTAGIKYQILQVEDLVSNETVCCVGGKRNAEMY